VDHGDGVAGLSKNSIVTALDDDGSNASSGSSVPSTK
jgi:hypothetical protein